jgi:cell wall-associated NlpC family hydrolase
MDDSMGGRRNFRLLAAALVLSALLSALSGCAAKTPPPPPSPPAPPPLSDLRDLLELPQRVDAYLAPVAADQPVLSSEAQQQAYARLRERHFAPWHRQAPAHSRADALWGLARLRQNRHYGENLRLLGPAFAAEMEALAQPESYPNTMRRGIATANTSLRVLPTQRPGFLKPNLPGEGYPFDYWQNSGLLAGTPVLVTHASADGAWLLVEGRTAAGWVPVADIALVDDAFVNAWESLPLAAVTREGASVAARFAASGGQEATPAEDAAQPLHLFSGRIGMLLPMADQDAGGLAVLAPARQADGSAVSLVSRLSHQEAEPAPLLPTPRNFARLADQLMGQPYGWGGFLGNRDCSALLLDLYAPFGIFLPRNSRQQSREGLWQPFGAATPEEKEARLLVEGRPLLTLLHKPGHIMLYLGSRDGRAVILHDLWGLRTKSVGGTEGRYVVGRVAITTLTPGRERPEVERSGTLLQGLDGMTQVCPTEGMLRQAQEAAAAAGGQYGKAVRQ